MRWRLRFPGRFLGAALAGMVCTTACAAEAGNIDQMLSQQKWDEAILALEKVLKEYPRDASSELRLATTLMKAGHPADAKAHIERAETFGAPPGLVAYRRAQYLATSLQRDAAFAELDRALELELVPALEPRSDRLLDPLRADPRFSDFLDRFDKAVAPCRHDPRYRAFDFWVGTWDVRRTGAAPQSPASTNVITLELQECVVQEHWTSAGGDTGTSLNIFDGSRQMWFQTWVDSGGGLHEYHGNPDEHGNMVLVGEMPGGKGQPARLPTRLTLSRLDEGHVRQFSESSADGGRTWTVNYDLLYTRRLN
jgi:hypothetical protein